MVTITGTDKKIIGTGVGALIVFTIFFMTGGSSDTYGVVFSFPVDATCDLSECHIIGDISHNFTSEICVERARLKSVFPKIAKQTQVTYLGKEQKEIPTYGDVQNEYTCPTEYFNYTAPPFPIKVNCWDETVNGTVMLFSRDDITSASLATKTAYWTETGVNGTTEITVDKWKTIPTEFCLQPDTNYTVRFDFDVPISSSGKFNITVQIPDAMGGNTFVLDPWWDSSFFYKMPINITSSIAVTDYQIQMNVTYNAHMEADFGDIRFVNEEEDTLLDYELLEKVDSTWALFWIEVDSIDTDGGTQAYMYYGSSTSTTTLSNATATWIWYDNITVGDAAWEGWGSPNGILDATFGNPAPSAKGNGDGSYGSGIVYNQSFNLSEGRRFMFDMYFGNTAADRNGRVGFGSERGSAMGTTEYGSFVHYICMQYAPVTSKYIVTNDSAATVVCEIAALANTWYNYEMVVQPNYGNSSMYMDGELMCSTDITFKDILVYVGVMGHDSTRYGDNFRLGKYVYPEPVAVLGAEQDNIPDWYGDYLYQNADHNMTTTIVEPLNGSSGFDIDTINQIIYGSNCSTNLLEFYYNSSTALGGLIADRATECFCYRTIPTLESCGGTAPTDLVYYLPFDNAETDAIDIAGTKNFTLGGTPTQEATGEIGKSYDMDADADWVWLTFADFSTDFDNNDDFTITGWFTSETTSGDGGARIITRDCNEHWCIQAEQDSAYPQDLYILKVSTAVAGTDWITSSDWYHLALVNVGSTGVMTMYLNYDEQSASDTSTSVGADRGVCFGSNLESTCSSDSPFLGKFDDWKFYNRTLTDAERLADYNKGNYFDTKEVNPLYSDCDYFLTACKTSGWVADKTYCVINNITADDDWCLDIDANNVTVDGRGHWIGSDSLRIVGLDYNGNDDGTLKNITFNLSLSTSTSGLDLRTTSGVTIEDVLMYNGTGILDLGGTSENAAIDATLINFISVYDRSLSDKITSSETVDVTFIYNNSYGEIYFLDSLTDDESTGPSFGLGQNIDISSNFVYVSSSFDVLDTLPANVTLLNTGITGGAVYKDGVLCGDCTILSSVGDDYIFNVTGWSNYTIGSGTKSANFTIWTGSVWENAYDYYMDFRCFATETDCEPDDQTYDTQPIYKICNNGTLSGDASLAMDATCDNIVLYCGEDYAGKTTISTLFATVHSDLAVDACTEIYCWADYSNPTHGCFFETEADII